MRCRGVRGATTADDNTREAILAATRQLLALMIRINGIEPEDVGSAIFSLTRDLDAEFPPSPPASSAGSTCRCFAPTRSMSPAASAAASAC